MKSSLLTFAMAFIWSVNGAAQSTTAPSQQEQENAATRLAEERVGMGDARTLAKVGNLAQSEAKLSALNRSKPGTAEWHMESAQRLLQTAEQLAREGDPQYVPALVGLGLDQLGQAERLAMDDEGRAAAKTLAGFIYERYLADEVKARANYEAAAQLVPAKALQAAESAERLRRRDDNLKEKVSIAGR